MSRARSLRLGLAGIVATCAVLASLLIVQPGGPRVTAGVDDIVELLAALVAAAACSRSARRHAGAARRGWALLGWFCALWALGQLAWTWFEVVRRTDPFPSVADAGFLAAVPFAAAAMLRFPSDQSRVTTRLRWFLDATIVSSALLFVSWAFLMGPIYRSGGGSHFELAVSLAYPVGDVVILAIALAFVPRVHPEWRSTVMNIAAGLGAIALSDSLFAYLTAVRAYDQAVWIDTGWVAGFLLIALASTRQPRHSAVLEDESPLPAGPWTMLSPYLPVAASVVAGAVREATTGTVEPALIWTGMVMFLAVIARQVAGFYEMRDRDRALADLALKDALTGLPNRQLFLAEAASALGRGRRAGGLVAVLFVDIDDFKNVNDSLGHEVGDRFLIELAARIHDAVRPGDVVARLGGDEFTVLVEGMPNVEQVTALAGRIAAAMHRPVDLDGMEVVPSASIGVAVSNGVDLDASDLLRNADLAMYEAKRKGKNRCELFAAHLHEGAMARVELAWRLKQAMARGEFVVHYQPTVQLPAGTLVGVEALVRWNHPERGLISPADFIPLAEESGVIVELGRWVLHHACQQVGSWRRAGLVGPDFELSVNLSARQFHDPGLLDLVSRVLDDTGFRAVNLMVEITESILVEPDSAAATLEGLRKLGVRVGVDDFGTGYSSLSYLQKLPVDVLKIDRLFVDGLGQGSQQTALADAIVRLALALGLETVAEGVERPEQVRALVALRCGRAQGFLFSPPLEAAAVVALLGRKDHAGPPGRIAIPTGGRLT